MREPTGVRRRLWTVRAAIAALAAAVLIPVGAPARADTTVFPIQFGNPGDKPIVGNWPDWFDGDDAADEVGVYRPSNSTFYLRHDDGYVTSIPFGAAGDVPVTGNFFGGRGDQIGIYRPSTATFHLRFPNGGVVTYRFGNPGDSPLVGNWDGDVNGLDEFGVYRPSTRQAFLKRDFRDDAPVDVITLPTVSGDIPFVMRRYGSDEVGFYRPSTRSFHQPGNAGVVTFGNTGDRPLTGDWSDTPGDLADLGVYRPGNRTFYRD